MKTYNNVLCGQVQPVQAHNRQVHIIIQELGKCHFPAPFLLWSILRSRTHSMPDFSWIFPAITEIHTFKAGLISLFSYLLLFLFAHFRKIPITFSLNLEGSLNHMKESLENWSEDGVTNIVQTFCGLKQIRIMVYYIAKTNYM